MPLGRRIKCQAWAIEHLLGSRFETD